MNLTDFLADKEWYDNSKISTIISCPRKAYYSHLLQGGLEAGVGPGADFGTCIHGGIATYYMWWGKRTEPERRALCLRNVAALHESLFTGPVRDALTPKHTIENALAIMDHYCTSYMGEDLLLKPIEVELAGAVEITPNDDEAFDPFWYIFRIDGVHLRLTYNDYWIRETKTTSGGVDREITKLCLSRQPRGYLYCARQFPGIRFTGVMPDVVGVMAKTLECRRDYYPKPISDTESWRAQTITIVEEWRAKVASTRNPLHTFYQQTGECTAYGKCAFFDLCRYGVSPATLSQFRPNRWNPLDMIDAPLPDVEKQLTQTPTSLKESIKL